MPIWAQLTLLAVIVLAASIPAWKLANPGWLLFPGVVMIGFALIKGGAPTPLIIAWLVVQLLAFAFIRVKWVFYTLSLIAMSLAIAVVVFTFVGTTTQDADNGGNQPVVVDVSEDTSATPAVQAVINDLHENGWAYGDDYVLNEEVDPSLDGSTAGDGAFCDDPIQDVAELLEFLGSETVRANALLDQILTQSVGTKAEVFDSNNWVIVQSLVPFRYLGNTMISGGLVVDAGGREGEIGDIFFAFFSPSSKSVVFVRGACANAQVYTPVPVIPTDDDDGDDGDDGDDDGKSSDPTGYVRPIDRPRSVANPTPDATPPDVATSVPGGGGVVDTPTNPPGSESGVNAPGATEPTQEPVPEPETGVNPEDGSGNSGDPGLPAGF